MSLPPEFELAPPAVWAAAEALIEAQHGPIDWNGWDVCLSITGDDVVDIEVRRTQTLTARVTRTQLLNKAYGWLAPPPTGDDAA